MIGDALVVPPESRIRTLASRDPGQGEKAVPFLQYEVREGREAGEVVVLPKAFSANCNGPVILRLDLFEEE